ncbi:MAG: UDP-N-acetylmuramate dehydrogenase [Melioribacteraceae bacterium]|nr:UDP-N-acetylmuramate dehydrogenase [Melioribacteraceae bacterium]
MNLHENYSLKNYNTFGIDVKARYFIDITSEKELQELLSSDLINQNKYLVLGSGSNILLTVDFDGLVIKYSVKGIQIIEENKEQIIIEAAGGEIWDDLVTYAVQKEYYGIENLSLIPGTVGAAPIQNIGAYGVELKDTFHHLECLKISTGLIRTFSKTDCNFQYRNSIFKNELKNKCIITKVTLELSKAKKIDLSYKSLSDQLKDVRQDDLTIKLVSDTVKKIRRSKLPDPNVMGNAGSFFKNPELTKDQFAKFQKRFPDAVYFKQSEDSFKIAAGWLIEKCGFKGKRIGNTGAYEKQALIIVNYGGASGSEIKELVEKIQNDVQMMFGIFLDFEVNIV